jgi:predicted transcriptional regulator
VKRPSDYLPANIDAPPPKIDPWLELVEDGADMLTRELPPMIEIVQGIVAEFSKLSLVSSAKCFKTWVTITLSLCISLGNEFLGRSTVRRRVLYVNLELKPDTFTRRLQAIAKRLGILIDRDWFSHLSLRGRMAGLSVDEVVSRIMAIARHRGATVIVIDPVFKLNVEGDENSSRDQTVFFNQLDRITTEGKATLILNDHSGKGNQSEKDPLDVIRGSSAKGGDLDAAMVLRKHEVDGCFRVDLVHRELPPVAPFVIGWRYPLMELRPDLSADAMKKPKGGPPKKYDPEVLCAAILDSTAEKGISISAWAAAAGVKRPTLQGYLPGLRAKGWIATAGEGNMARQFLTDKGREAVRRHQKGPQ